MLSGERINVSEESLLQHFEIINFEISDSFILQANSCPDSSIKLFDLLDKHGKLETCRMTDLLGLADKIPACRKNFFEFISIPKNFERYLVNSSRPPTLYLVYMVDKFLPLPDLTKEKIEDIFFSLVMRNVRTFKKIAINASTYSLLFPYIFPNYTHSKSLEQQEKKIQYKCDANIALMSFFSEKHKLTRDISEKMISELFPALEDGVSILRVNKASYFGSKRKESEGIEYSNKRIKL